MRQNTPIIKFIIRRATKQILRNLCTSVLGLLLIFLLISSYAIFLYHNNVSQMYREIIECKYPSEVLFCRTSDEENKSTGVSDTFISDVMQVSHIEGYNRTSTFNAQLIAIGNDERWQENANNQIPLVVQTDINTSLNSYFMSGQIELLTGRFPNIETGGVLVDSDFIEEINGFYGTADHIRLDLVTPEGNYFLELPITGTYKTIYPIECLINDVPVRQNVIFLNEATITNISDQIIEQDSMTFFLDSHYALDKTMIELYSLNYDHENYNFFPSLSLDVSSLLNSIRVGEASQKMIMVIYWIISTGVMVTYLINDYLRYRKNIRIYSLLGERTRCIVYEYCFRILVILGIACVPSGLIVVAIQPAISKNLLNNITQPLTEGSFYTTFELQRNLLQHNSSHIISLNEVLLAISYLFFITSIFFLIVGIISCKQLKRLKN